MKDHKITGEIYKKSIGSNLSLLSKEVLMNFTQDDPSVLEYSLLINNIAPQKECRYILFKLVNWKSIKFPVSCDMNLKFCLDKNIQDCLIWEHNREFYIFSNDTETNNFQNFKQFLENMCVLIYSNTYETKIEKVDIKKSQEFITFLGEVINVDKFIDESNKKVYCEDKTKLNEDSKKVVSNEEASILEKSSSKSASYVNFKKTYPRSKVVFQAKVP